MAEEGKKDLILHQFGRAKTLPNISPFCLKLETFLRLAKIPYENDFNKPQGPYGKAPWMTYKGTTVTDSALCIEFLTEKLNLDVDNHLSNEEKAIGRAMVTMMEDHFLWSYAMYRWVYDEKKTVGQVFSWGSFPPFSLVFWIVKRRVNQRAIAQGIGHHPKETVLQFGKKDLKAFSDYLGTKKYFFSDRPTSYDCAIFGNLAQALWSTPGSDFEKWMTDDFPNLKKYCLQMKDALWPDWEDCLAK